MKIAIIGTGRLGTSLGRALAAKGERIAALYDLDPKAAARARRRIGRGKIARTAEEAARAADVLLLCVPDRAVAATAKALAAARRDWRGKIVLHTCGVLSSRALAPLRRAGARTGSLHPAQAFPRPDLPPRHFRGVSFAVEGDREAAAFGRRLARRIGGVPFSLRPEDKPLYHAACGMASSLLVPLFDLAAELLEDLGLSRRKAEAVLGPLVEGTVRGIGRYGRAKALTGPITRNDAETVDIHLKALRAHPEHGRIYRQLGMRALKLAEAGGLGRKDAATIRRKLGGK